jgi:iron complex outermembrane receptor protein
MRNRAHLLSATALAAAGIVWFNPALAQDASGAAAPSATRDKPGGAVAAEDILKEIVVSGRQRSIAGGLMIVQRQPETTNSISAEAIKQKMGIAGPYQLVATLPGVNTGQSDPYQMSIRYALQLRGLPMNKIGWVVDGVNAMDRAYLQPYSETYADNENLAGLTILPGSTRITDPVQTAVAGEFSMTVRDPDDHPGAQASYGYGSYKGQRIFAGIDTGLIGNTGLKAFGSISYTQAGTFALAKDAVGKRLHVDFKVAKDWGELGKSTLFLSYGDWSAVRSQAYTLAQYRADQKTGDFTAGNYLSSFNPQSNTNNYWKYAVYTRRNLLLAWNNDLHPTDRIDLHITPYYQWIFSNSPGESALNPNSVYSGSQKQAVDTTGLFLLPNGNIPVKTNVLQRQFAAGVNSSAKVTLTPSNNITFGWWYDHWQMTQLNSFSPIAGAAMHPTGPAPSCARPPACRFRAPITASTPTSTPCRSRMRNPSSTTS